MPRPPSTAHAAAPYRELAQLSEQTWVRLEAGDDAFLEEAIVRRDVLLAAIARTQARPVEVTEVRAAIRDVLLADRRLRGLLESRRDEVRQVLTQTAAGRTALESYRGHAPAGSVYIERLS